MPPPIFTRGTAITVAYVGLASWSATVERVEWPDPKTCVMTVRDEHGKYSAFKRHRNAWRSLVGGRQVLIAKAEEKLTA